MWPLAFGLVALTLLVYWPTLQNGFVSDDREYVVNNFSLRSSAGLYNIWFKIGTIQQYYPLVFTTFWGEYQLWGLHPAGYHAVNMLLHAMAAILVWRVLVRLDVPGAWLAAAIFAVHPVEVESVAWVSERKNVLSCALALAAMLCYWRFAPPEPTGARRRPSPPTSVARRYYGLSLLLFVGALLSKTVTASMPAVLLVILWWKRGRLTWLDVRPLLPFFAVGIGLGVLTVWMEKVYVGAQGDRFDFTLADRLLIAGRAVWFYAGKLAWPYPLMFFYPRWTIDPHVWWQSLFPITAVALVVVLWLARNRIGRGPLAAALIFGGILVPAIGFFDVFPFRFSFVADHYQYHASIALITLAAAALTIAIGRHAGHFAWALPVMGSAVLLPLIVLAHQKTRVYWDNFTLHTDVARLHPDSWVAHNNIAGILLKEKKYDKAIDSLRNTIRLIPNDPVPHGNLGRVLTEMGRYEEAMQELNLAMKLHVDQDEKAWISRLIGDVQIKQNQLDEALENFNTSIQINADWTAYMQRGRIRAMRGDTAEAIGDLNLALKHQPDSAESLELRAKVLASAGEFDKALADLQTLRKQLPQEAEVLLQMGGVQQAAGRHQQAIESYSQALLLDPKNPAAFRGRADCQLASGKQAAAASDYRQSIQLDGGDVNALNNLAWILATSPDDALRSGKEAVQFAAEACRATGNSRADLLSTLAAAHAESGDYLAAIDWLQRALPIAPTALQSELKEQLESYESKRPWREPRPR
jgi:tetratricopeptide (TPR) repeat protein